MTVVGTDCRLSSALGQVRVPPRRIEQLQNLLLPVRQQVKGIGQTTCLEPADVVLDEDCGHGWTEERFAGRDGANGRKKVLGPSADAAHYFTPRLPSPTPEPAKTL